MNIQLVLLLRLHHTSSCLPCWCIWSFPSIVINVFHSTVERGGEWGRKTQSSDFPQGCFRSIFAKNASVVSTIGKSLNLSMKHCCGLAWLVRGKWDSREKCDSRYRYFCLNPLKMLQHAPNVVSLFAATSMTTVIHLKTILLKHSSLYGSKNVTVWMTDAFSDNNGALCHRGISSISL